MAASAERASPAGGLTRCHVIDPARDSDAPRIREAAVTAARRGWAVFPCRPGHKPPAIDRWEQRASRDPEHVAYAWQHRYSGHNIGIACGPSGLVGIDLDTAAHGGELPEEWQLLPGVRDGADVLAELGDRAGADAWPWTYTVRTPSGGLHLYFTAAPDREIRNSAGRVGPLIDVRGRGGYLIGAGSVVGGRLYDVIDDRPPEQLPRWLADRADPSQPDRWVPGRTTASGSVYGRLRGLLEHVLAGQPGDRNGRLYWASNRAAEMVKTGVIDRTTAERVLLDAALEAGLRGGEREARKTIASGFRGASR